MGLTQVNADGVKDDAISAGKIPDDAIGLAHLAAGTDGQVITYDASGNPVAVGPGTDGQVLTSTGAGSPPAFEDAVSEGTQVKSTGESGGTKFLREDGDGTCSWQTVVTTPADDSIAEVKLDISNAPSDRNILQYKDSTDKLTWVSGSYRILNFKEWYGKSWSTHTGDTGWHGNVIDGSAGHAKITPTLATSKIAVWGNMNLEVDSNNASTTICGVAVRVSRKVSGESDVEVYRYNWYLNRPETSGDDTIRVTNASFHFVDDPSTTSEVEYFVETSSHHSSATINIGSANHWKGITMMELAA